MYKRGKTGKIGFTKNHMKAIFLFAFDVTPKSGKKADWLIQLKKLDEDDAEKNIEQSLEKAMVAGATESQSTAPSTATSTTSHNENASCFYHRCTDAIKEMQSEMTALQIALIVWREVNKIDVDKQLSVVNDDDSVESDNECDYAKCLFDALYIVSCDAKMRDVNFVMDLVVRVDNFIENYDFTEAEFRRME